MSCVDMIHDRGRGEHRESCIYTRCYVIYSSGLILGIFINYIQILYIRNIKMKDNSIDSPIRCAAA